jgi:hypothetical protein
MCAIVPQWGPHAKLLARQFWQKTSLERVSNKDSKFIEVENPSLLSKWGVVAVLVKLPMATRPWALPVLAALYRPPEWDRAHGTRHKTPVPLARRLLARLIRWFPERHFIVVGDSGAGTSETARCCGQHHHHLTLVSKFDGDAALYEPPPPRTRGTIGRPRVKGETLASPQEVVAHTTNRTHLTVAWYGGTRRDIAVVTGTGHWYHIGEDLVAVRWVYVHGCTGTHRDAYLFTTNLHLQPNRIVECYTQRWSIETTFQECREYLRLESPKCDGKATVFRFTPCVFGLSTTIILLSLQLPDTLHCPSVRSWHGKTTVTFADMMVHGRRALWKPWFFQTPAATAAFSKLPTARQETIVYALAPAA